jgi:hypothetical protein
MILFESPFPVKTKMIELNESGHFIRLILNLPEDCYIFDQINQTSNKKRKVYYTFSSLGYVFEVNKEDESHNKSVLWQGKNV